MKKDNYWSRATGLWAFILLFCLFCICVCLENFEILWNKRILKKQNKTLIGGFNNKWYKINWKIYWRKWYRRYQKEEERKWREQSRYWTLEHRNIGPGIKNRGRRVGGEGGSKRWVVLRIYLEGIMYALGFVDTQYKVRILL